MIMSLPEGPFPASHREGLNGFGQQRTFGFVDQQMQALRHHYITANHKEIALTDALQRIFKKIPGPVRREVAATAETTRGERVKLPVC
jgi:hypothetical protein